MVAAPPEFYDVPSYEATFCDRAVIGAGFIVVSDQVHLGELSLETTWINQ